MRVILAPRTRAKIPRTLASRFAKAGNSGVLQGLQGLALAFRGLLVVFFCLVSLLWVLEYAYGHMGVLLAALN